MNALIDTVSLLTTSLEPVGVASYQVQPLQFSLTETDLPTEEVGADGHAVVIGWAGAAGTATVELDPVQLTVEGIGDRLFPGFPLGELPASVAAGQVVVTVSAGRRIRGLHLADLATDEAEPVPLTDESGLGAGRRLAVSARDPAGSGWLAPVVSAPEVGARGQVPATLTGGTFSGSVLRLPDVAGSQLRIGLVEGDTPGEFQAAPVTVGTVTGWAAPTPRDLELVGPDGTVLWAFPGELLPGTRVSADVTVGVAAALQTMHDGAAPLAGTLTLRAAHPCRLGLSLSQVTGALLRRIPGTLVADLEGEPVAVALPGEPAAATPTSVIGDLHVRYLGMRLADISDPLPPVGPTSGLVVRADPVHRVFPEAALRGESVTRIGLIGFCPEESALLVRLVPADLATTTGTSAPDRTIGRPAVVSVPPGERAAVVWVDLPEPVTVTEAVAVEVSAGQGRFHWAAAEHPLVRIVVVDPDPGNRPVVIGATDGTSNTLLTLTGPEVTVNRAVLPAAAFTGTGVVLASAVFARVEITDTELRHRQGV
ncbi:hypothetical protein EXU48_12800 [Occultella glacieicola]|uniref:Uncharacterized protein n=1 Tax=Occultella glacieicola TaxID=2518684 RepID=A0ABY2E1E7_9MICO|nr:hypothetical protein [Occultella glacieicola]TDE92443.1 hypothetical protein EXU48_12800 [Occultella glacieicola]